jgi:hypothetical protein
MEKRTFIAPAGSTTLNLSAEYPVIRRYTD